MDHWPTSISRNFLSLIFSLSLAAYSVAPTSSLSATPIDVTWVPPFGGGQPFTFDSMELTPHLAVYSNYAPPNGADPGRLLVFLDGFLEISTFFNDGVPVAVPGTGYPSGEPYTVAYVLAENSFIIPADGNVLVANGTGSSVASEGYLVGNSGAASFTQNSDVRLPFMPDIPLNRLSDNLPIGSRGPSGMLTLSHDPLSGAPLFRQQLTLPFVPLGSPPLSAPYWMRPALSPGQAATLELTFTSPGSIVTRSGDQIYVSLEGGAGNAIFTSPVPEANIYGMLVAGLGLLAFIARRKPK